MNLAWKIKEYGIIQFAHKQVFQGMTFSIPMKKPDSKMADLSELQDADGKPEDFGRQ